MDNIECHSTGEPDGRTKNIIKKVQHCNSNHEPLINNNNSCEKLVARNIITNETSNQKLNK